MRKLNRLLRGPRAKPFARIAPVDWTAIAKTSRRCTVSSVISFDHCPRSKRTTTAWSECITFKQELQLLDQVVGYVWKDGTKEEPAFFIDEEDHDQLMHMLGNRLAEAKPIFREQKCLLPPLPRWGKGLEYIRREVESFLAQLTTLYDFKTERDPPQSKEDHAAIVPIPPDPFRTSFKDRPSPPPLPTSLKQEITSQSFPLLPEERTAKDQNWTLAITGGDATTALAMNTTHQDDCNETRRMSDTKHHAGHCTKRETLGTDAPLVAILIQAIQAATKRVTLLPADVNLRNAVARDHGSRARSKKSATIRQQLGMVVPQRLTGDAEIWYFSLPEHIGDYFMNRSWMEKTRKQALAIRYRDSACPRELPSQYFIRKRELLELAYENSEGELISDIMAGAPRVWNTILTPRLYRTTSELQQAIKLHEDDLLEMEHLLSERPI
ncbi:hypothetical protein VTO73DRAFT_5129 [Trametes versicolor]